MNETLNCDVLVVGGGPAGVVAALGAARSGAETLLVTDRPVLGGNSSSEIRVWTRGSTGGGNLFAEEMGIWGELKLANLARNPTGNVLHWDEILLDAALTQPKLRLLLNTTAQGVTMEESEKRIRSVHCRGIRTEKEWEIFPGQVVDCTGDGFVAKQAGIPYRTGREGKDVFDEALAQAKTDAFSQGCSLLLQSKRTGQTAPYTPPSYIYTLEEIDQLIGRGGRIVTADMGGSDCWWFEYGGQLDVIGDDQQIFIELRRIALGIWNYIKNSGKFAAEDLELEWIGSLPGRRASRRLVGEETLVQQDVLGDLRHEDAVCYGGWFMDSHPSGGIQSDKQQCQQLPVHCYSIPLSCMFNQSCDNLLFAGRNLSASYMAFVSSRIMNTCALTGQAAGSAAALCALENITVADLWFQRRETLLEKLAWEDALLARPLDSPLPGSPTLWASSVRPPLGRPGEARLPLTGDSYVVFPAAGGPAVLQLEAETHTTLRYRWETGPLPSRCCEIPGEETALPLHPGVNEVRLSAAKEGKGFVTVFFQAAEGVSLVGGERLPGVQAGYRAEGELFFPSIRMEAPLYEAQNAGDGFLRPWNGVHAWVGEGLRKEGEKLKVTWETPIRISHVSLYFDPDLSMELASSHCPTWDAHHHFALREGMPPMLVKDYRLVARRGEKVFVIAEVTGNIQRRRAHDFPPMEVDAITLRVTATWGGDPVVYQLAVK